MLSTLVLLPPFGGREAAAYNALISWRAVSGADGYRVYVRHDDGSYQLADERTSASGDSVTEVVEDIPLASTTRFAVTALAGGVESVLSNEGRIDYAVAARVADSDGDGLSDAEEDLDLDGVKDPNETDAHDPDTDNDGLSDFDERVVHRTDPLRADTDGDSASDAAEVAAGTDPKNASSSPNVWLLAGGSGGRFAGKMTKTAAYTAGSDADPAADSIGAQLVFANSTANSLDAASSDDVTYTVSLPKTGDWYLWGRFYYPGTPGSNDANSFFVRVDGGPALRFGNNKSYFRKWHWDGDGRYESGTPLALPLGRLSAGVHVLTVEKREVVPVPPRLDALFLTLDRGARPTDTVARTALETQGGPTTTTTTTTTPSPACTSNEQCDDHNACNGVETCNPTTGCKPGTPLACNDGQYCNGQETCDPSAGCVAGRPVRCGAAAGPCEVGTCNESLDRCEVTAKADGTRCSDGAACTIDDSCVDGACLGADACAEGERCNLDAGVCELSGDRDFDGLLDGVDPCPDEVRNLCFGDVAIDHTRGLPIRINAGESVATCSGRKTDCNGDIWFEDFGAYKQVGATSCNLLGGCPITAIADVFGCTSARTTDLIECDHAAKGPKRRIIYKFAVANGTYVVNLFFANTQLLTEKTGATVFDIRVEDRNVYPRFDQVAEAGGSGVLVVRSAVAEVTDGELKIVLVPRVGKVAIKAIEVVATVR